MLTLKYFLLSPGFVVIILIVISCALSGIIGRYKKQPIMPAIALGVLGPIGWLIVWFHKKTEVEIKQLSIKRRKWSIPDFILLFMFIISGVLSLAIHQWLKFNIEKLPDFFVRIVKGIGYVVCIVGKLRGAGGRITPEKILDSGLFFVPFAILIIFSLVIFFKVLKGKIEECEEEIEHN